MAQNDSDDFIQRTRQLVSDGFDIPNQVAMDGEQHTAAAHSASAEAASGGKATDTTTFGQMSVNGAVAETRVANQRIPLSKLDAAKAEAAFQAFLEAMGFDVLGSPHMRGTPARVVKMYTKELFHGCYTEPPVITSFDVDGHEFYDELIYSGPLTVRSTCSHHMLPIVGEAHVGLILSPDSPLPGLSKYGRVVDYFASMPQVQERMTKQIADHLFDTLRPRGLGVCIRAKHMCQCHRGTRQSDSQMITSALRGVFKQAEVRAEFMNLIQINQNK